MYPDTLPDEKKLCWSYDDIFAGSERTVRAYTHGNFNMNMHYHDFYELNIVLCGSGMHYLGVCRQRFEKGDVFVIPPGNRHGYLTEGQVDVFHILLHRSFFAHYYQELSALPGYAILFTLEPALRGIKGTERYTLHLAGELEGFMPELIKMQRFYYSTLPEDDIALNALTLYIISRLCLLCGRSSVIKAPTGELQTLAGCIRAVQEGCSSDISADSIAKDAAVSRATLFRIFKRGLGMTPGQYINLCRLDKASICLRAGEDSIADIAQNCGFFDSSHFIRAFSERFGVTPARYRKGENRN